MVQEYFIILMPAFLLGILHTLIPCEDKAIFFFWSFGIAKTPKKSIYILMLYGLGLITSNMIIASVTVFITQLPIFKYTIIIHLLYFVLSTILTLVFFRSQNDFLAYYRAGEIALNDFMELYNPDNYTWSFRYFPLVAFYFIPFYLLGFDLGFVVFNSVNLILNIIISVYLYKVIMLIRREDHEDNDDRIILYICIFLLSLPQLFNYFL
ncbi:unnamed protein product, partial [marine sediment metagenome]